MKDNLEFILNVLKHDLDSQTAQDIYEFLEQFGKSAEKALAEYKMYPPSDFFSYPHLMKLVNKYRGLEMGLYPPHQIWGELIKLVRIHGVDAVHQHVHPAVMDAINRTGGSASLGSGDTNQRDFLTVYEVIYQETLKRVSTEEIN